MKDTIWSFKWLENGKYRNTIIITDTKPAIADSPSYEPLPTIPAITVEHTAWVNRSGQIWWVQVNDYADMKQALVGAIEGLE